MNPLEFYAFFQTLFTLPPGIVGEIVHPATGRKSYILSEQDFTRMIELINQLAPDTVALHDPYAPAETAQLLDDAPLDEAFWALLQQHLNGEPSA